MRIFARSIEKYQVETPPADSKPAPWFVYLQGGPGANCPNPWDYPWTHSVLDRGYKLLFLDQRGTGLSSAITAETLALQGKPAQQADYLRNFRADSIVEDCEAIRRCLTKDLADDLQKWSILGQSFGGFCAITYLSKHPEGLKEAFLTGGLAPMVNKPDEVYKRTFKKLEQRNEAYYNKYPEDAERVKKIINHLQVRKTGLPSGGSLTPFRFLQIGIAFGMHGGFIAVHELVLSAWNDINTFGLIARPTLSAIDAAGSMDDHVLYAILHEPIYCQGQASDWSADRVRSQLPQFLLDNDHDRLLFFGEMVFRDMFYTFTELRKMWEVADIVAGIDDWPALYDEKQLARNEVPVYAATFIEDMYVDFGFAQETAGKIKGCKQLITNIWYHNALRAKSDRLMDDLFALKDDVID